VKPSSLLGTASIWLPLAACGGVGARASPAAPPAVSGSATSSAASAKPAASASAAPAPTATTLPAVATDTTTVTLTRTSFPVIQGKGMAGDLMDVDQANHMLYASDATPADGISGMSRPRPRST
jgi:hypothetical protein